MYFLVLVVSILAVHASVAEEIVSASSSNFRLKFSNYFYSFRVDTNQVTVNNVIGTVLFSNGTISQQRRRVIAPLSDLFVFKLVPSSRSVNNGQQVNDLFQLELGKNGLLVRIKQTVVNNSSLVDTTHYFRVVASSKINQLVAKCYLMITFVNTDLQQQIAPKFERDVYHVQVRENNAPDLMLIRLKATLANPASSPHVSYHIVDNYDIRDAEKSIPFQIKSDTGELFVRRMLNYEQRDFYSLQVMAIDPKLPGLTSTAQLFIRVVEQNDRLAPGIADSSYNITLTDTLDFTQKPLVFTMRDKLAQKVSYYYSLIGNLNDLNTFEIEPSTGDVRLVSKLNHDTKSQYKLSIVVRDISQLPSSAQYIALNVAVESSVPINPSFQFAYYEFIVLENATLGQRVGRVHAFISSNTPASSSANSHHRVTKSSVKESIITYSLENNNMNVPFRVDPNNGTIFTTAQRIAKYTRSSYEFYVMATVDQKPASKASVKVKIRVLDLNDNVPEFNKRQFNLKISEEVAIGLPLLTLTVINRDATSTLEYSIENDYDESPEYVPTTSQNNIFVLAKQSATRVYLTLDGRTTGLNYKKKSTYSLRVKVIDQDGLYSYAYVKINIQPNLSFSPKFTQDIYTFELYENAKLGTFVGKVEALGAEDSQVAFKMFSNTENLMMNNGESDEELYSNEMKMNTDFRLDEQTGNLYVSGSIDREKYDKITLYITARYRDRINTRTDHAIIQLSILDTNDNLPQFTRKSYQVTIYPNTPIDSNLLRVEAVDKDIGLNGLVQYSIQDDESIHSSPIVTIDSKTGRIKYTGANLSTEFKVKQLTLVAKDHGHPPLVSKTILLINFVQANKQTPRFDMCSNLEFDLCEQQPVGTRFGYRLSAHDPDLGRDADLSYQLLSSVDSFQLEASGDLNKIYLTSRFVGDYDSTSQEKSWNVTVRVWGSGPTGSSLYSDCQILVRLKSLHEFVPFTVPDSFRIIFNNYKNHFLTEQLAQVPLVLSNMATSSLASSYFDQSLFNQYNDLPLLVNFLSFSLVNGEMGKRLVGLNRNTGELVLKPILNSNSQIDTSFYIRVNDGDQEIARTQCVLEVTMLSEKLIAESVTLNMLNVDIEQFLSASLYESLVESVLIILPKSQQFKKSNVHVFSLVNSHNGVNVSLAVSYDYEQDIFMPGWLLKQVIFSGLSSMQARLATSSLTIYSDDEACAHYEPCLNYQQCITTRKFSSASTHFSVQSDSSGYTPNLQFRSIQIAHDFTCSCIHGYTGRGNKSATCDLEINLCYSNPCQHGSVCVSVEAPQGFYCVCPPGFTGHLCQYDVNNDKCCSGSSSSSFTTTTSSVITATSTTIKPVVEGAAAGLNETLRAYGHSFIQNSTLSEPTRCIPCGTKYSGREKICQSGSSCKNLILGGTTCDQCPSASLDSASAAFYNKFCELRARHFPSRYSKKQKSPRIVLDGLVRNRFRFSIKLTFSTTKSNAFLLYNSRVDSANRDFISLRIQNEKLVFEYSLGGNEMTDSTESLSINELSVSDGQWRTVTIEYKQRNVTLSVDNDILRDIDACELANSDIAGNCYRVSAYSELPSRCQSLAETGCYRLLDLNGPLVLGNRYSVNEVDSAFEGCIMDVIVNGKLINLDVKSDQVLSEWGTEPGCRNRVDKLKHYSAIAEHLCPKSSSPCFNDGKCSVVTLDSNQFTFNCSCLPNTQSDYHGPYCQYSNSASLSSGLDSTNSSSCPAGWWGRGSGGLCGPCECDPTKNFSPDCDSRTGQCNCLPNHYLKYNRVTREAYCVPCDCFLEGSTSLQCDVQTGQCKCVAGAGITGRRCDRCVSPYAEMNSTTSKGIQCLQLQETECPHVYSFNTWWPRVSFGSVSNATCPRGSSGGRIYRTCQSESGWLNDVDLSECKSNKLMEHSLYKWSSELSQNNLSQLNAYQAFKLVEDMNKIIYETETEESDDDRDELTLYMQSDDLNMAYLATSPNSLYALDVIAIKNVTRSVLEYELGEQSWPSDDELTYSSSSFLYMQDRNFLSDLFKIINHLASRRYDLKMSQFRMREIIRTNNLTDKRYCLLCDMIPLLNKYLFTLVTFNRDYYNNYMNGTESNIDMDILLDNFQFYMRSISSSKPFTQSIANSFKFKLVMNSRQADSRKMAFALLSTPSLNLPTQLILGPKRENILKKMTSSMTSSVILSKLTYRVASSVFFLSMNNPISQQTNSSNSDTNYMVVADFALINNYEAVYDSRSNLITYRSLFRRSSGGIEYVCARLDQSTGYWSSAGAKLVSHDSSSNTIRCSFDERQHSAEAGGAVFAVIAPAMIHNNKLGGLALGHGFDTDSMESSTDRAVDFSVVFTVFMSFSLFVMFITILVLLMLRKQRTALTVVYTNFCLNLFIVQFLFLTGVNSNNQSSSSSLILCKIISILQHYFNLTSYVWLVVINLHLYRMLAELRDINRLGSSAPVFYYAIGYLTPIILISLTLGIKQDVYTNIDSTSYSMSNMYCWLNVESMSDLLFVYIGPIAMCVFFFLALAGLSFREFKKTTFKQTDLELVKQSLFSSVLILPIVCATSCFQFLFIRASIGVSSETPAVYEYIYLLASLICSFLLFCLFILFNKNNKTYVITMWTLVRQKLKLKGDLDSTPSPVAANKVNKHPQTQPSIVVTASSNNFLYSNEPYLMPKQHPGCEKPDQVNFMNSKYMLEYFPSQHNQNDVNMALTTNSISTTTTSGTIDDTTTSTGGTMLGNNNPVYLSHLINTTTTTATNDTTNSDFNSYNYNYDFNRPPALPLPGLISSEKSNETETNETDLVDVGKILRARNMSVKSSTMRQVNEDDEEEEFDEDGQRVLAGHKKNSKVNSNTDNSKFINVTDAMMKATSLMEPQPQRKPSPLGLFWPNAVAECDTSFLEGSDIYTPSKLPYSFAKQSNSISPTTNKPNGGGVPNEVTATATSRNNTLTRVNNRSILNTNNSPVVMGVGNATPNNYVPTTLQSIVMPELSNETGNETRV